LSALNPDDIRRIGPWPVKKLIGQGGFSWVFEVEDENLGVPRALKMLKPEAALNDQFERFLKEARLLSRLKDPHLVTIYALDRDVETGCHYYVMEYLSGTDLAHVLRDEGALPWKRAVPIFLGALQGLAKLHQVTPKPIVHRDIAPANIQITAEGEVKLLDLGIARVARAADDTMHGTDLTGQHGFIGRPKYASPEQLGQRELGPASDVFSMGLSLFEAIEGRHPYADLPDIQTLQYTDILMYYGRLSAGRNEITLAFHKTPRALREVIRKAVRVRAADRYRDAGEMREALARAVEHPEPGPLAGVLRVAAALAVVSLIGVGGWWAWERMPVEPVGDTATEAAKPPVEEAQPPPTTTTPPVVAREEPRPAGPTREDAERERGLAQAVKQSLDEKRAAKTVDEDDARTGAQMLAEAEGLFESGDWKEAMKGYRAAASFMRNIRTVAPPPPPETEGLSDALAQAGSARSAALAAAADRQASRDFEAADDKLTRAQSLPPAQGAEALKLAADARQGFERATKVSATLLADAQQARDRAEAASRKLPSPGSCSGLESDARTKACQAARAAFERGDAALAQKDGAQARTQFNVASARYDEAIRPTENQAPTLTLAGGGGEIELGQSRVIRARASDSEDGDATVTFTLTSPSGARETHEGTSLTIEGREAGTYRIAAVARDSEGKESAQKTVAVAVREVRQESPPQKPTEDAPPEVASTGDVQRSAKGLLSEYQSALQSRDIDAVARVWKMNPKERQVIESLFDGYEKVSAAIVFREARGVGDDQMEVRFTQQISGWTPDGLVPLGGGNLRGKAVRRSGGWQFTELPRE
jgi:serine/threonine-protein kinase